MRNDLSQVNFRNRKAWHTNGKTRITIARDKRRSELILLFIRSLSLSIGQHNTQAEIGVHANIVTTSEKKIAARYTQRKCAWVHQLLIQS
jgi:hypothetical protein